MKIDVAIKLVAALFFLFAVIMLLYAGKTGTSWDRFGRIACKMGAGNDLR